MAERSGEGRGGRGVERLLWEGKSESEFKSTYKMTDRGNEMSFSYFDNLLT